ncbi:MAG TPA: hemerythrin domain-containing protein, partial [Actinocrinis sp.]|uniref:hemerythrin domain-containing protein n=1 Tax=Actinocrinis sp. TaxID=1920516 RepID=UPI002DDD3149
ELTHARLGAKCDRLEKEKCGRVGLTGPGPVTRGGRISRQESEESMNLAQKEREAAAALPVGSVLAVLYNQHARIRDLFELVQSANGPGRQTAFDHLRELLAIHEAGEEMVVRPVTARIAGSDVADARNHEEAEAAHVLAELEKLDVGSAEFARRLTEFEKAVSDHAEHEEAEEFPRILAEVSVLDQQKMGERLLAAQKIAPTHPHPGAAGSPMAQAVVGPFAALLDKAKDTYAARKQD